MGSGPAKFGAAEPGKGWNSQIWQENEAPPSPAPEQWLMAKGRCASLLPTGNLSPSRGGAGDGIWPSGCSVKGAAGAHCDLYRGASLFAICAVVVQFGVSLQGPPFRLVVCCVKGQKISRDAR